MEVEIVLKEHDSKRVSIRAYPAETIERLTPLELDRLNYETDYAYIYLEFDDASDIPEGENIPRHPPNWSRTICFQVRDVWVPENWRRRGIARQLYEVASDYSFRRGVPLCSDYRIHFEAYEFWRGLYSSGRARYEVPGGGRDGNPYYGRFVLAFPPPETLA